MTARPWYATKGSGGLGIKGSQAGKGEMVADFSFSQQEDRDLIIKAVNSHDALVAALKAAITEDNYYAMVHGDTSSLIRRLKAINDAARAALQQVEG